jgi:hypothetical protein
MKFTVFSMGLRLGAEMLYYTPALRLMSIAATVGM